MKFFQNSKSTVLFLGTFLLSVGVSGHLKAEPMRRGLINYCRTSDAALLDEITSQFSFSVGTENANAIRSRNPNFEFFIYTSVTDNYVDGAWHQDLLNLAQSRFAGVPDLFAEDVYLHFYDNTVICKKKDYTQTPAVCVESYSIPGCFGARPCPANSRVPVYLSPTLNRRLVAFHREELRTLQRDFIFAQQLTKPLSGTSPAVYPSGVYLDNASSILENWGVGVESGGHVEETKGVVSGGASGGRLKVNQGEFTGYNNDGWYEDGLHRFTRMLTDYADQTPINTPSGTHYAKVMRNISTSWDNTFTDSPPVAHSFYIEMALNPLRDIGSTKPIDFYDRNRNLEPLGIEQFYNGFTGTAGSFTKEELFESIVSMYWIVRGAYTSVFIGKTHEDCTTSLEALRNEYLRGIALVDLGPAKGGPRVIASGTDPLGQAYSIVGREFENGWAILRNRANYGDDVSANSEASVSLPASLYPVRIDGNVSAQVSSYSFRNGEGKIFLKTTDYVPPENDSPVALNQVFEIDPDTSTPLKLGYEDLDGPGPYSFVVIQLPENGELMGAGADRIYVPDPSFVGTDTIRFNVSDGLASSNVGVISIFVGTEIPSDFILPPGVDEGDIIKGGEEVGFLNSNGVSVSSSGCSSQGSGFEFTFLLLALLFCSGVRTPVFSRKDQN